MGRFFSPRYEYRSSLRGIRRDHTEFAGQRIWWYRFSTETMMDSVYDMGMGREYHDPFAIDTIIADRTIGAIQLGEEGLFTRDFLYVLIAWDEIERRNMDSIQYDTDSYLRDRLWCDGKFFTPRNIKVEGEIQKMHTIIKIDAMEVRGDEVHFDDPMEPTPSVPSEQDPMNP